VLDDLELTHDVLAIQVPPNNGEPRLGTAK
jgi:hypothetical protein